MFFCKRCFFLKNMDNFLFYKMKLQLLLFVLGSKHVAKSLLTSKLRWKQRGGEEEGERRRKVEEERDRKTD
jgi:hypothetical protein